MTKQVPDFLSNSRNFKLRENIDSLGGQLLTDCAGPNGSRLYVFALGSGSIIVQLHPNNRGYEVYTALRDFAILDVYAALDRYANDRAVL